MAIIELDGSSSSPTENSQVVDLVVVHGVFEDGRLTWIDPVTRTEWLKDFFPRQRLQTRVLMYTYDATALTSSKNGTAGRTISFATTLVAELCANRELADASKRPIIFLCHGFGGIIVKRALAFSSMQISRAVEHQRSLFISTYAILFLGTPHSGATKYAVQQYKRRRFSLGPSQFMLKLLKGSELLEDIKAQFAPLMKCFQIYSFWEERETEVGFSKTLIVDRESAASSWDVTEKCGINATHSTMVKFKSSADPGYLTILSVLERYAKDAPESIAERWRHEAQQRKMQRWKEAVSILGEDVQEFALNLQAQCRTA